MYLFQSCTSSVYFNNSIALIFLCFISDTQKLDSWSKVGSSHPVSAVAGLCVILGSVSPPLLNEVAANKASAVIQVNSDFSGGRRANFLEEPPCEIKTLDVTGLPRPAAICVCRKKRGEWQQRQSCVSWSLPTFEPPFWKQKGLVTAVLWFVWNQRRGWYTFVLWRCQSNCALLTFLKVLGLLKALLNKRYHKYLLSAVYFHVYVRQ